VCRPRSDKSYSTEPSAAVSVNMAGNATGMDASNIVNSTGQNVGDCHTLPVCIADDDDHHRAIYGEEVPHYRSDLMLWRCAE
jgi:hypothetical protein